MTSNVESMKNGDSPYQEVQERLAEVAPAWGISHLLGLENTRALLADARQRTSDSHRAQMNALGVKTPDKPNDMGGITVQGDTTNTFNITQPPAQGNPFMKMAGKLLPYALTLALGSGAGLAGTLLYSLMSKPSAPVQQQTVLPDYKLRLEVKDKP